MTKQNYLRTDHAKRFSAIVRSLDFEMATDAAMLAYMAELGIAKDAQDAAARNWKREGAMKFLQILQNIATADQSPTVEKWPEMVKT